MPALTEEWLNVQLDRYDAAKKAKDAALVEQVHNEIYEVVYEYQQVWADMCRTLRSNPNFGSSEYLQAEFIRTSRGLNQLELALRILFPLNSTSQREVAPGTLDTLEE